MAPVTQKKKQKQKPRGIGVDFKKVKHKVGRKLASASNVTKVDVKSKAIVLPGQSVARDKEGLSINIRKQTLKELLTQTPHHNNNVRKDALLGIKDLLTRHPKELSLHSVTLMEKLCPRITDKNKSVRQTLLDLLRTTIFPGLPQILMRPLIPIVMAYVFSAMTNLSADIRMSAFGFLNAVIHSYPLLLSSDYVGQICQCYVDFLGKLGIAGLVGKQLPEVLESLLLFLSAVHMRSSSSKMRALTEAMEDRGPSNGLPNSQVAGLFIPVLHWYRSFVAGDNRSEKLESDTSSKAQGARSLPLQLAEALVKALASCWAECAPLVCSGQTADKDSMECMIKICKAMHVLLRIMEPDLEQWLCVNMGPREGVMRLQSFSFSERGASRPSWIQDSVVPLFLRHLIGSFPICAPPINLPKKVEESLLNLNIRVSEVIIDFIMAGELQVQSEPGDVTRFLDYVEDALNGRMLASLGLSSSSVDKRITDSHLKLLVTFIPGLLSCINRERQLRMLEAFTNVFLNCKPTSNLKHACLSCIAEILQPSYSRKGAQTVQGALVADIFEFQKQWLQALPKLLWELKESHSSTSLAILRVLHHLGRSAPQGSPLAEEYMTLQPILIPFFSTLYPFKKQKVQRLHGPFLKLPLECQQLAIDLLFYFNSFSHAFLKALTHCLCPDLQTSLVVRCIEVIRAAYCRGSIGLSDHLSFCFTLLVDHTTSLQGISADAGDTKSDTMVLFHRHRIITGAICSSFQQVGDGRIVLQLLKPSLCHYMGLRVSALTSYGLIKVVAMLGVSGCGIFLPKSLFAVLPPFLAKYLVLLAKEKCFQKRTGKGQEPSLKAFVHPCLRLLSKSAKLTEAVFHELCMPQQEGGQLHAKVVALIQVLGIEHVRTKLFGDAGPSSFLCLLQEAEGWVDVFEVQEGNVRATYGEICEAAMLKYGWKERCSLLC